MGFATLNDLMMADCQLRVWCFRCFRWQDVPLRRLGDRGAMPETTIEEVARRFRCKGCKAADQVMVVPASAERSGFIPTARGQGSTDIIAGMFHAMRGAAKRRR